MIYGYVVRRVRSEDVEDVLQEVLRAIVERYSSFEGLSTEKTWTYSVCRFTVFKYYSRRNRENGEVALQAEGKLPPRGTEASPLDVLISGEKMELVRKLMNGLRPIDREILELRFVEELSFAEIAGILELESDEACRSRCRRALAAAQKRLRASPLSPAEA
ncbi:MAG: sigma-70 family RNA polymerase sigma factor [Planctomycetes bacterium]|nr:sigma-70 family RNA polymerase sigma factor [Planctomycetota bacterium]